MTVLSIDFLEVFRSEEHSVFLSVYDTKIGVGDTIGIKHNGDVYGTAVVKSRKSSSIEDICRRIDNHPKTSSENELRKYLQNQKDDIEEIDDVHQLFYKRQEFPELEVGDEVRIEYESQISKNFIETEGIVEDIRNDGVVAIRDNGQNKDDIDKRRLLTKDILGSVESIQYGQKTDNMNPGFRDDMVKFGYDWDRRQSLGTLVRLDKVY